MVASGLLCPNCKKSFSEMEDLMLHVNNCAQEQVCRVLKISLIHFMGRRICSVLTSLVNLVEKNIAFSLV